MAKNKVRPEETSAVPVDENRLIEPLERGTAQGQSGLGVVSKELLEKLFQTLDDERKILEAIMENTRTQLAYFDNQFNFIMVNSAYAQSSGYNKEELIGRNHFDLFPHPENEQIFQRVRQTGQAVEFYAKPFCYTNQPWRGTTYWDWSLVPVKDKKGMMQGLVFSLTDVTEQIKSKQRLEEALTKLRNLNEQLMEARRKAEQRAAELDGVFEAMIDAVTIFDAQGRMSQINPVATSFLGLRGVKSGPEAFVNNLRALDGQLLPAGTGPSHRALQGERIHGEYYKYINQDGQEFTILASAAPLKIRGMISGAVATWHDVTEREHLLGQLEHERALLASVLEQMPSAVIILEASTGKLLLGNEQVSKILRYPTVPAFSGKYFEMTDRKHEDGTPYDPEDWPLARALNRGQIVDKEEMVVIRGDNTQGLIEISAAPIYDRDGSIVAGVAVFTDITERREAEEKLQLAGQLQQIIEFIPDAIFVLDEDRRVIAWNRAMERFSGIGKADVIGKKDSYHGAEFFQSRRLLIDYVLDQDLRPESYRTVSQDNDTLIARFNTPNAIWGKEAYLEVRATPLKNEKGQVIGAIESIRDITRQQEMEEESLKAQKIESLGLLAGGIAHDFNNFLTAILANVQLARLKLTKGMDVARALQNVEETIVKASDLTRQLLTFSKGGAPLKRTTAMNELLQDTVEFVLRGSKAACQFAIADNLWMVNVDPGQISQVISNLAINAIQAMPDGGILTVRAENAEIGLERYLPLETGRYIKIAMTDQGVGIPPEHLSKIFDPYFTTKHEGNGLGLATSYFIISNHGGHIGVESQLGAGTTFTVYLPAALGPLVEQVSEEPRLFGGRGKILLMDDDLGIIQASSEMLEEIGYEVEHAYDGKSALQCYLEAVQAENPFDLVILDLTIPGGMGGKETIAGLREINPDLHAIVSSGYPDDPVMLNYTEYGFAAKLVKPYTMEILSEVLQRVLGLYN